MALQLASGFLLVKKQNNIQFNAFLNFLCKSDEKVIIGCRETGNCSQVYSVFYDCLDRLVVGSCLIIITVLPVAICLPKSNN